MKFKNYLISYFIGQLKCISANSELLWIEKTESCGINSGKKVQASKVMAEYIKRKNEAWLKKNKKRLSLIEKKTCVSFFSDDLCIKKIGANRIADCEENKYSNRAEYIKRKNEVWFKNKEMHLKSVKEHFKREKKSLDRVCLSDERLNGYGALGEDLSFSYSSYSDFYVSEYDRRSHIRNTQHGPVLVRGHRVRAHKK